MFGPRVIQKSGGQQYGTSPLDLTLTNVRAGSTLVVLASVISGARPIEINGGVDSRGNAWKEIAQQAESSNDFRAWAFLARNVVGGTTVVRVQQVSGNSYQIQACLYEVEPSSLFIVTTYENGVGSETHYAAAAGVATPPGCSFFVAGAHPVDRGTMVPSYGFERTTDLGDQALDEYCMLMHYTSDAPFSGIRGEWRQATGSGGSRSGAVMVVLQSGPDSHPGGAPLRAGLKPWSRDAEPVIVNPSSPQARGLVAMWPFPNLTDVVGGLRFVNQGGTAQTRWALRHGRCLFHDENGYMLSSTAPKGISTEVTLSAWLRVQQTTYTGRALSLSDNSVSEWGIGSNNASGGSFVASCEYFQAEQYHPSVLALEWAHVVGVFNSGASISRKLYVNGKFITENTQNWITHAPYTPTRVVLNGRYDGGYGGRYDFADVRIYNRLLNDTEVLAMFQNGADVGMPARRNFYVPTVYAPGERLAFRAAPFGMRPWTDRPAGNAYVDTVANKGLVAVALLGTCSTVYQRRRGTMSRSGTVVDRPDSVLLASPSDTITMSISQGSISRPFTLMVRMNASYAGGVGSYIARVMENTGGVAWFGLYYDYGWIVGRLRNSSYESVQVTDTGAVAWNSGQTEYTFALTVESGVVSGGLKLYQQGVLIASADSVANGTEQWGDLVIGGAQSGANALVKEVRLYDRVLAAQEIKAQSSSPSRWGLFAPTRRRMILVPSSYPGTLLRGR